MNLAKFPLNPKPQLRAFWEDSLTKPPFRRHKNLPKQTWNTMSPTNRDQQKHWESWCNLKIKFVLIWSCKNGDLVCVCVHTSSLGFEFNRLIVSLHTHKHRTKSCNLLSFNSNKSLTFNHNQSLKFENSKPDP